ncbi:uncharacterized protein LOC127904747 [Populus trichocarpa]|uniref:uncharacterized protein LOC127904747 n=3 Tax=Populus trichocarpa TaxID=3694 RepID=UPI002279D216|nr:uncharacterized protein LOC127904747 [Populus trichocarpa]
MHIEKNMFENIFNTVMDVKGKTKDNLKARLDIALYCNQKNMELVYDESRVAKPRASFVLEKNAQLLVYKWLKSLRFPDGHASNISRLVNIEDCRLYGMKSHDCHVFMQTLIPLAFRDLLPKGIWDALTEISHFFRDICSSKLNVDHIERLQTNIVETLCKLEMIFPPSFFDSMEHLPIHLPFEAKAGGPVQYRWMYPFERYLFNLKKKVKNKAHVEASICEAYIVEEISTFISYYFEPHLRTRINRVPRHDDGGEVPSSGNLSIFSNTGRPTPKNAVRGRYLSEIEFKQAHNYVLFNCDELRPFIQQHRQFLLSNNSQLTESQIFQLQDEKFATWFRTHVYQMGRSAPKSLSLLSLGPERKCKCYNGYFVNGYVFHTEEYGQGRKTYNSGVCVKGSTSSELEVDYYGRLEEVVELQYHNEQNIVFLFKCYWYDTTDRGIRVDLHYGLVEINSKARLRNINDVFVFAKQCQQVYYTYTPSFRKDRSRVDWLSVLKTKPRGRVEVVQDENEDTSVRDEVFQVSEVVEPYRVAPSIELEENSNFRVFDDSLVDVDADELNFVLSSSGQPNIDEEDDIHIEDCDEGDDNSIDDEEEENSD